MGHRATLDEQIASLKYHDITFNLITEAEARIFLTDYTYFYKLKSYRENYPSIKTDTGITYRNLDFKHLVEISRIDFHLSRVSLHLSLAVEHATKIQLNNELTNQNDPEAVQQAIDKFLRTTTPEIRWNQYTEHLYNTHAGQAKDPFAPWHLWELSSFNTLLSMYDFLSKELGFDFTLKHMLFIVRKLRNSVSHGSCLLTNMNRQTPNRSNNRRRDNEVTKSARYLCDIKQRRNGMRNTSFDKGLDRLVVHNFAALLYSHLQLVNNPRVLEHAIKDLESFISRMKVHKEDLFGRGPGSSSAKNELVYSTLTLLEKLCNGYISKAKTKITRLEKV